jgi:hypothetical protein
MTPTPPVIPDEYIVLDSGGAVVAEKVSFDCAFEALTEDRSRRGWMVIAPDNTQLRSMREMHEYRRAPSAKGAPSCDARDAARYRWLCEKGVEHQIPGSGSMRQGYGPFVMLQLPAVYPMAGQWILGTKAGVDAAIDAAMAVSPSPDSANASSVDSTEAHGEAVQRPSSETER